MTTDDGDALRAGQAAGNRVLTPRGLRTRSRLLVAARQVFEVTAFADARLIDITAAAGLSAGSFYTYFDDKETIFREVAADVLEELSRSPRLDARRLERDPVRDIADSARQYFHACLRNARVVRSMEQLAVGDDQINNARRETVTIGVKRAARWIEDLQAQGICDTEIDPWTTAMVLHTMNVRVAYDHLILSGDERDVDGLVEAVTHVWARTVGLEPAGRGRGGRETD